TEAGHGGMGGRREKGGVFVDGSPAFEPQDGFKGAVLARYADSGSPLKSGYLIGEKYIQGKAAAVDAQLEAGHVILLGFRPQWRGQPLRPLQVLFYFLLFVR